MPRNPENPKSAMWPDDVVEKLKSLWSEGISATECAKMLSEAFSYPYSRNSIIGKVHKLKLKDRPTVIRKNKAKPKKKPAPRAEKAKRVTLPALPINRPEVVAETRIPVSSTWQALPDAPAPKPLHELGEIGRGDRVGECRWPIGENPTLFCACPAHGPYCPTHQVLSLPKEVAA